VPGMRVSGGALDERVGPGPPPGCVGGACRPPNRPSASLIGAA
jgi:hypothetical protein